MLSRRNRQAIEFFRRARHGAITDAERNDPLAQETIALVSRIFEESERFDRQRQSDSLLGAIGGPRKRKADG